MSSNIPVAWFAKHPIVSTLLWLCGSKNATENDTQINNNKLSWRDEYGGQIADYDGKSDTKSPNEYNKHQYSGRISQEEVSRTGQAAESESDSDLEINQSPQWGFYVSITPPQDIFPKQRK